MNHADEIQRAQLAQRLDTVIGQVQDLKTLLLDAKPPTTFQGSMALCRLELALGDARANIPRLRD